MIGKLYNVEYIEGNFPRDVQKYKNKDGEHAKAIYGITVNEASKNFLWGCLHAIKGPFYIYNSSLDQYEECYRIEGPAYNGVLIPEVFFERIEDDSATIIAYEEESIPVKEEKKSHKVTVRKVTNDHDYFCYLAKKYGYNLSKLAPLPRRKLKEEN